jgi:hypothetical protein
MLLSRQWWLGWQNKAEERRTTTTRGNMEKFTVHLTVKERECGTADSTGGLLQRIEREVGETGVQHSTPILQAERIKRESAERGDHHAD